MFLKSNWPTEAAFCTSSKSLFSQRKQRSLQIICLAITNSSTGHEQVMHRFKGPDCDSSEGESVEFLKNRAISKFLMATGST
jgi:hypothetical protein